VLDDLDEDQGVVEIAGHGGDSGRDGPIGPMSGQLFP
jgi:hypothetical protein